MTREQVKQLMLEAGLKAPARGEFIFIHWDQIAMLIENEREACAKVCDEYHVSSEYPGFVACSEAIRARSQS